MPLHDVGAAGALPFNVEGQQPPPTEDPLADVRIVAPGYFETMKIQLLAGRFLDERDAMQTRAPASSTRRWRGDTSRIAARSARSSRTRTARAKWSASSATCTTRDSTASRGSRSTCRCARARRPAWRWWRARTRIRRAIAGTIQRVIWDVDPEQPIYELSTMDQILARAVFLPRLSTTLLATFALAALLLAALGIYGVLSYSVSQRTKEIGLRMALGASGGDTVALIVRSSVVLVATGGAIGLVAAVFLARSMAGAVRRRPVRSAGVRAGGGDAGDRRGCREPAARVADDAGRSGRRAARAVSSSALKRELTRGADHERRSVGGGRASAFERAKPMAVIVEDRHYQAAVGLVFLANGVGDSTHFFSAGSHGFQYRLQIGLN